MTRYKIQKFYKIDTAMFSEERAISEAKDAWKAGNKNLVKINVVSQEKRGGAETIIKTFEREVTGKTEIIKL